MHKKRIIAGAPFEMHKRGKETDAKLLAFISSHPNLTVRQIAKQLHWSIGRVDGSVNRLAKNGRVRTQPALRKGILIKKVFAQSYSPKPKDLIEIPKDLITSKIWNKSAKLYALSRSTIGISSTRREEWEKKALTIEDINLDKKVKNLQIQIPEKLSEFYELENSETSLSVMDDLALLTIESTILPIDIPSTQPVKIHFEIERETIIKERIRIVGSIVDNEHSEIGASLENPSGKVAIQSDLPDYSKRGSSPIVITDDSETNKQVISAEVR